MVIKRLLRYIKRTISVVLCFGGSKLAIKDHVNLNFTSDLDKRGKYYYLCVYTYSSYNML